MSSVICPEEQCTGCAACFNICPGQCISMISDVEGFLRPEIDLVGCDDCGACKHVCPMLHPREPDRSASPHVYACWNKDEKVRFQSASGGAFSAFAENVLDNGGYVFGAAFDEDMRLKHVSIHRPNELGKLRSSKYVQSDVGNTYSEIRNLLRQNRTVLFSGTPCQVSALNAFLGEVNENLLTCDVLCHGVPSPQLFDKYIKYLEKRFRATLIHINLRHKRKGWKLITTVALFSDGRERVLTGYDDSYMYGFLHCLSLRPACYRCQYTTVDRCGDISLADFWGIGDFAPFHHNTRNGISLILVNSEKGQRLFNACSTQLFFEKRSLEEARYKRPKLSHPQPEPTGRKAFFADYQGLDYEELARRYLVDKGLKGLIKRMAPRIWLFYLGKYYQKLRG